MITRQKRTLLLGHLKDAGGSILAMLDLIKDDKLPETHELLISMTFHLAAMANDLEDDLIEEGKKKNGK